MELYDNALSPYAFKVRALLYEKGIAFEKREMLSHAQRQRLLELNPRGEVPALVDGVRVLTDSKIICSYVEEVVPSPPLLPADAGQRAKARSIELWADTDFDSCIFVLSLLKLMQPELATRVPDALPRIEALLDSHYARLEQELGGRQWFLESFSLADIAVAAHMVSSLFFGYRPDGRYPALAAWAARAIARPSIDRARREMGQAATQFRSDPQHFFQKTRLHWRNDRIEYAIRCGLGPWLLDELAADRAFLSPIAASGGGH